MVRAGLVGLGKMGISHCSILNAHHDVDLVAVCDASKFILAALEKHGKLTCFTDYQKMVDFCDLDCLVVATPTKFHHKMVCYALKKGIHVFVEKPFCLHSAEGKQMVELAAIHKTTNQVGYHNRFLGTFTEAKRLIATGVIGDPYHVLGEAYVPVVLKEKGSTWRSQKTEGGGCLYDYASHVLNLVQFLVGTPQQVAGSVLRSIYSKDVDDAVYSTLLFDDNLSGQLSVNWSDESYRKMSTQLTVQGKLGKVVVDATECKIYLRADNELEHLSQGWNIKYLTDLTKPVDFNLRGEEYSLQIDYFIDCILKGISGNVSSFQSALDTDLTVEMILKDAASRK